MSQFIGVPLKKTSEVDLFEHLSKLVTQQLGNVVYYNAFLRELNDLRKQATFKGIEGKALTTLSALQKYYDQLTQFFTICPQNAVLNTTFKWKDAFDKGAYSFLAGATSINLPSLAFEKICVLFNVAASYTETAAIALNEDSQNEYALQMGAKHFQQAAGIFAALETESAEILGNNIQATNLVDLNVSILNILHHLMLAQAQESVFLKACQGSMKHSTLSKIAAQVEEFYSECVRLIQVNKTIWPEKEWYSMIHSKKFAYAGVKGYYQGVIAGEEKRFGEQIAWLNQSTNSFQNAIAKFPLSDFMQNFQKKATKLHEDAVRDNDFIYHSRVPESLATVERAVLVKATPVPTKFLPVDFM